MTQNKIKLRLINKIIISVILSLSVVFSVNTLLINNSCASTHVGVAVYVNSTAITNRDILDRARLTAGELGIDYNANKDMLIKNTTRTLIIEELQIQYAKLNSVTITRRDLNTYLVSIVKKLQYKNGIRSFLQSHGIKMKTFRKKAYAKLLWGKVISKVSKANIMQNKKAMQQKMVDLTKTKQTYDLSEIVLPFKSANEIKSAVDFANKLRTKLLSHKDQFGHYALKFSQSATSSFEGRLGAVHLGSLPKTYKKDVVDLQPNTISKPIQLEDRVLLIMRHKDKKVVVNNQKKVDSIKFYRLIVQAHELQQSGSSSMQELVGSVMNYALNCGDLDTYAKKVGSKQSGYSQEVALKSLSPEYQHLLLSIKPAEIKPVQVPGGVMMIMVCKKGKIIPKTTNKLDVKNIQKEMFTSLFSESSTNTLNDIYSSAIIGYNK